MVRRFLSRTLKPLGTCFRKLNWDVWWKASKVARGLWTRKQEEINSPGDKSEEAKLAGQQKEGTLCQESPISLGL